MSKVNNITGLLKVLLVVLCLLYISTFIANIPVFYERMSGECITEECLAAPGPPPGLEALQKIGMNGPVYALFYTVVECLFIFGFLAAAFIVYWKRGNEIMGMLGTLLLVGFGVPFPSMMTVAAENEPKLLLFNGIMTFLGWVSFVIFFLIFPNGKFVPSWSKWVFILLVVFLLLGFFEMPLWVVIFRVILMFVLLLYAQIYRYRNVSTQIERQQTKWVVYGFSVGILGYLGLLLIPMLFNPNIFKEGSPLYFMFFNTGIYFTLLLIPVTLTFALLRRRLWDIDPLVNRTLLYAIMTVAVIGIYTAVVWYLSNLFKTDENVVISIIATSIVAVSFSPLKEKVQKVIIRRLFGEQENPYFVIALLGKKLQESKTPEQVVEQVLKTLKEVIKLPFASINLLQNGKEVVLAQFGEAVGNHHRLPISYRGTQLGYLTVSPRSPGEAFTSSDEKLWEVLIQQLGPLLQDLKATVDLKALNVMLQESREKLVLAREEERKYLRRNLHDDLAPRLAALAYTAAAAEELVDKEPLTVKKLLSEHQQMILGTVDDIRRLVYDLRPPSIDELGLLEALRLRTNEIISSMAVYSEEEPESKIELMFIAPEQLQKIPPAIEVAVYRIITESVVNVVRHSKANKCEVHIYLRKNRLELEVIDNGIGISRERPPSTMGGIGLTSMRERAAELGGECIIERSTSGGTRVYASFPLQTENTGEEK